MKRKIKFILIIFIAVIVYFSFNTKKDDKIINYNNDRTKYDTIILEDIINKKYV